MMFLAWIWAHESYGHLKSENTFMLCHILRAQVLLQVSEMQGADIRTIAVNAQQGSQQT